MASATGAAKIAGVRQGAVADERGLCNALAENIEPLVLELMGHHDAFVPPRPTGKNFAPRSPRCST
jgi:electron transfer flavoprotein alpha subunit